MSDDKLADAVTWAITHAQKAPSPEQLGESVAREIRAAIDERLAIGAFGPFGVWRQAAHVQGVLATRLVATGVPVTVRQHRHGCIILPQAADHLLI